MTRIASSITIALGTAAFIAPAALAQSADPAKLNLDGARGYQAELLSDASNRTSLLAADNTSSGYNKGKFAITDGGASTLNISGFTQFRYVWNHREDDGLGPASDTVGFQEGRTKLILSGNMANSDIDYLIRFRFVTGTGASLLDYAYANFNLGDGFKLRAGQFLTQMVREEVIPDYELLFVERSVMDAYFTVGYAQGVQLSYENDSTQLFGSFTDGMATQNTDFNSTKEADWAVTGRVNWKWAGDWKQANEFTGFQSASSFGMVGAAATYQQGGDTGYTVAVDKFQAMMDAQVKGSGWNTYGVLAYRSMKPDGGATLGDFGALVQGGFFVSKQVELIAGWDIVVPDSSRTTNKDFNDVRAGFSYYISPESQAAKFTMNISWFPNKQSESIVPVNTGVGVLSSSNDNQFALQAQLQILF